MFSVTDVSTYLFCPRKLYLYRVLEFEEPPSELLVLGKINHLMFDQINKMDKDIVSSIQEFDPAKIREQYRKSYFKALKDILNLQKDVINGVNLKTINIFHDSWPRFLEESELRADNVVSFIKNNNIFGKELWEKLTPKYLTEVKLQSEKLMLRGIVDRIEINEENAIPYEIKTGNPPKEGVWPGHKIQLIAYMLLAKENLGKELNYGYVQYINIKEKRKIVLNPFSEIEIKNNVEDMKKLLGSKEVPPILENKNKCNACNLREQCYGFN